MMSFFLRTSLQNGWVVSNVGLHSVFTNLPPNLAQVFAGMGGAVVQAGPAGAGLYLDVHWWINPFTPFWTYAWAIDITGPAGVPDGVVKTQM
jgi:hypothetical protein